MFANVKMIMTVYRNIKRSKKSIEEYQLQKLKELLYYAKENVVLYQKLYTNVTLDVVELSDFSNIPVLSAEMLRAQDIEDITSKEYDVADLILEGTSGSSGTPFKFYVSRGEMFFRQLIMMRFLFINGWRPWWRGVNLWIEDNENNGNKIFDILKKTHKKFVSINWSLEKQYLEISKNKPKFIYAITSTIDILAEWMIDNGKVISSVEIIAVTGDHLSEAVRRRIKQAFGCKIINYYGASECGLFGWSCSRCGENHFDDDYVYVEIVDKDNKPVKDGEKGRILITVLNQFATPLIRYDIGDSIIKAGKDKSCTIPFSVFRMVEGREDDKLILADGRKLSFSNIFSAVSMLTEVKRIQFYQDKQGLITVKYIPKQGIEKSIIINKIMEKLVMKAEMKLTFKECQQIPLEKSGKFKLVKIEK